MTAGQGRRPISLFGQGKLFRLESLIKAQAATPLWTAKALSPKALKTGAGEGIRTLDPNLGKIRLYEISVLNQLFIKLLKNPNTIRTFLKAVRLECFLLNVLPVAATLNDPATRGSCVQVSRQGRVAALRPFVIRGPFRTR